jgi:hypothetical protein
VTPEFLREEASRFRGMAETVEREASRLRLLGMADDYESRAKEADALTRPARVEPALDAPAPDAPAPAEPAPGETIRLRLGRKTAKEVNGAV